MELIFKLPKDKLPFVGIIFESLYEASRLNQGLVNNHKDKVFNIIFEPIAGKVNLRLISQELRFNYQYMGLKYDYAKFKIWMNKVSADSLMNFSHLMRGNDKEIVAKTLEKRVLFVLKVDGYMIV